MNAAEILRLKDLLPTALGSADIRENIAEDILRRSIFSARMESARYLARVRDVCSQIADGAISAAQARADLLNVLGDMGHSQADGGNLLNPASRRRLNLVIETQKRMASSVARIRNETPATLLVWPAWELRRYERRSMPRADWLRRWQAAAESVGYEGVLRNSARMVALKDSPVWAALGQGVGGFKDTLGNPYPPFAYNSGLAWQDVSAEELRKLGLDPHPQTPKQASLAPDDKQLLEAAKTCGFDLGKGLA